MTDHFFPNPPERPAELTERLAAERKEEITLDVQGGIQAVQACGEAWNLFLELLESQGINLGMGSDDLNALWRLMAPHYPGLRLEAKDPTPLFKPRRGPEPLLDGADIIKLLMYIAEQTQQINGRISESKACQKLASDEIFRNKHASEIKDRTKPEYGDKRLTDALAATIERELRHIKRVLKFEVDPDRFNVVQRRLFSVWPIITRDEQPWRQRVADYRQRYKAGRGSGM